MTNDSFGMILCSALLNFDGRDSVTFREAWC